MRKLILTIFILSAFCSLSSAHSPKDIEIIYMNEEQVLEISLKHVVDDRNDHFIRKIEIIRNEEIVKTEYYPKQEETQFVKKSISITLDEGENIIVKVYSKNGGVSEKSFSVPELIILEEDK